MTQEYFLFDTNRSECEARVIEVSYDKLGTYVQLDATVCHPQGGGQPSDLGSIYIDNQEVSIVHVARVNGQIHHYLGQECCLNAGQKIVVHIDSERRRLHARYHSAAHWLTHRIESIYPALRVVKGHSFPQEAYLECTGNFELSEIDLKVLVNKESLPIEPLILNRREFETCFGPLRPFRIIRIGTYVPIPCGGTHVQHTSEISSLGIRKVNRKGDRIKVSFELL